MNDDQNNGNNMSNNSFTPRRRSTLPSTRSLLGLIFGIFMFFVYEGMAVLMFINFFSWHGDWEWTRWVVGVVLAIYGVFRAYRTYSDLKGHDEE